jgi:hypothetical protein
MSFFISRRADRSASSPASAAAVHAVGDGDDGRGAVHMRPHGARRLAVELRHGVGAAGESQPGHGHVERVAADLAQLGLHELAAGAEASQGLDGVDLVAGRHGRVSGEDDLLARLPPRRVEVRPGLHPVGDQLDAGEDRVSLVEVVEVDRKVERAERSHAADAQQHLLGDAAVGGGVVQTARDPAVALVHGLEQEERRDGVAADAPDAARDLARGHAHADTDARVRERAGRVVAPLVVWIPVGPDPLDGVTLRPAEADTHDGQAEVAGRLHEIAGEDAEPAGVGVELLVEPILHREVGDERRHSGKHTAKRAWARASRGRRRPGLGSRTGV